MKYRPSYPTYRSEPVGNFSSRYAPPAYPRLFVVDAPDYEMASNFARRRYDSNVRLPTRQPRYNRTPKNVRFDVSGYDYEPRSSSQGSSRSRDYEYRSPAHGSSRGLRPQNTCNSTPVGSRYESEEPNPVKRGLQEMSNSGRRVLGQRRRASCVWS